jgi:hypothetical protein
MTNPMTHNPRQQATGSPSVQPDANHPLPMRPIAHVRPELAKAAGAGGEETAVGDRAGGDDVAQLAGALRAAERAYRAYLAELCQADVEPVEDWPTWYAEYLLGLR